MTSLLDQGEGILVEVVVAEFWSTERVPGITVGWEKVTEEVVRDVTIMTVNMGRLEPS